MTRPSRLSEDLSSSSSSSCSSDPEEVVGTGGNAVNVPVLSAASISIPSSGGWNNNNNHRQRHQDQDQHHDFFRSPPEESSSTSESYLLDYPDVGFQSPAPPPLTHAGGFSTSTSQTVQQRPRQLSQQQRPPLPSSSSSSQQSYHPPRRSMSQHHHHQQQQQQYVPHPPEGYHHHYAGADQGSSGGSTSKGGGRPTARRRTTAYSHTATGGGGGSACGSTSAAASGHHHHRRKHHHSNRNRHTTPISSSGSSSHIQQQPSLSSDWSVTSEHSSTSYYSNNSSAVISQRRGHHHHHGSVNNPPASMHAASTQYNLDGSGSFSGGIQTTAGATPSSSSSNTTILSQLPSYYSSSTSSLFGLNSSSHAGNNNMVALSQSSSSLQHLIVNNNTYEGHDNEGERAVDLDEDDDSYDGKTKRYNRRRNTRFDYWGNSSFSSMRQLAHYYRDPSSSSPTNNHNNNHHQQQALPSLQSIFFELVLICSLKCRYTIRSLRKPCQTFCRRFFYCSVTVILAVFMLIAWLTLDFYMDAVDICTPPPPLPPVVYHQVDTVPPRRFESFLAQLDAMNSNINENDISNMVPANMTNSNDRSENTKNKQNNEQEVRQQEEQEEERPLVEYYVHGRGIGHYARSVAIVEQLNKAGIDVRLFLTRSAMWRAMHEDSKMVDGASARDGDADPSDHSIEEITTTPTASTVNAQLEKLQQPNKHRGHTTAISISSLTPDQSIFDVISHVVERVSGDCEVASSSGRYPQLIISDGDFPGMLRAEFGGIPSVGIAHGQLFSIAQKPSWVQGVPILNRAWNKQGRLNYVSGFFTEWQIATHFCFLESRYSSGTVARAPLRPEVLHMAEARKAARNGKIDPELLPQQQRIKKLLIHDSLHRRQRKLVICYFRDHNGEIVVQALLNAGFDVLLFDTGYYRDMQNDPNRYGVKWIINDREEARKIYIRGEEERRRLTEEDPLSMEKNSTLDKELYPILHRRLTGKTNGPRLIRITDRSLFVPLMHVADGVASSAGSQLMSECIYSHMPLLALYKENDDEQRLNVELSHHTDAPCHRPLVFGTSFEELTSGLHKNNTSHGEPPSDSLDHTLDQLYQFVREVRASPTSETYFRSLFKETITDKSDQTAKVNPIVSAVDGLDMDKDPFQGLPDAAAIILEIVKQVLQK